MDQFTSSAVWDVLTVYWSIVDDFYGNMATIALHTARAILAHVNSLETEPMSIERV